MLETLKTLKEEVECFKPKSKKELEQFRLKFLGKKGILNKIFCEFKNIPVDKKKMFGQEINTLKKSVQNKINSCYL